MNDNHIKIIKSLANKRIRSYDKLSRQTCDDLIQAACLAILTSDEEVFDGDRFTRRGLRIISSSIQKELYDDYWIYGQSVKRQKYTTLSALEPEYLEGLYKSDDGNIEVDEEDNMQYILKYLPTKDLQTFFYLHWKGFNGKEIGERLGVSPGIVRDRIRKAKKILARGLTSKKFVI